ncbi:MAG: hypothetical protein J0I47_09790 [Sphingomonas sp.]|uniref:hypothetical protein n=1 Tax=Sphingomonas sp. TaxID=28214 RepID=UPI001ACFEE2B|nr:hypothetical protein [Sphingomonas sp.]MBN8808504.1 hypothetical protein [Sphingomonas sp.]
MSGREAECLRALVRSAAPLAVSASAVRRRRWASALFVGERLTVGVAAADDQALDAWLASLPEADLPMRSGFVASAEVTARDAGRATLDLLVIDGD